MRDMIRPASPPTANWRDDYLRKLVSTEDAAGVVKSGDRVVFPTASLARVVPAALAARRDELENVTIDTVGAPMATLGDFFQEDAEQAFHTTSWFFGDFVRTAPRGGDSKYTVYRPETYSMMMKPFEERPAECPFTIDVVIVSVSPPDPHGYCSFGAHLWTKRSYCRRAKIVIAEVNENHLHTGGVNYIQVSEIDYLVEHTPSSPTDEQERVLLGAIASDVRAFVDPLLPSVPHSSQLAILNVLAAVDLDTARILFGKMSLGDPPEEAKKITQFVSELIRDGDTFQIGVGALSLWITPCGAFDDKRDLGMHSEVTAPGYGRLVTEGIVTGRHKSFRPGKVTTSAFSGSHQEDLALIDNNPIFEQYDTEYTNDIRTVSAIDNFVAINNAISVDLTGQINAETGIGSRMINGPGGQVEMHIGAILSRGGRAITLLPSTALGGAVSRIVPHLDQGAVVTIPRYFTDYIVTEYGIARLLGKDNRQRAEALTSVAHPDFRADLRKAAGDSFYP
ncbi:MAG: acetyl-CoA hydrolase/transferase C-terminal domain-containing protein [Dehalococcoidia bacterium]